MDFPARHWHKKNEQILQCEICPNLCQLKDNQRGRCFIRKRLGDQIFLTAYGQTSSIGLDPVEKKPLFHFLPGTKILSYGTIGCNLSCTFCQNWDISQSKNSKQLIEYLAPEDLAKEAKKLDVPSIASTYNEPIISFEYTIDVAKACHELQLKMVAISNGYISPKPAEEFYDYIDATNIDLKGFTEYFYQKITGAHLQPVLDNLKYVKNKTKTWLEITTLLIPGLNDSAKEVDAETKWILDNLGPDVPLHFSAFYPAWQMPNIPHTSRESLVQARNIALKNGLRYVYIGNMDVENASNTFCHHCKSLIIERTGYTVIQYNLTKDGDCKFCGTKCAGIF